MGTGRKHKSQFIRGKVPHRLCCMFACETRILQQLAVLVACHGVAVGQIPSHYFLVQRPMSWSKAREFCQRHYVDLVVLDTEEQYFALLNATLTSTVSFWLGLQRKSVHGGWTWVNGEALRYKHWYRWNYQGRCASMESMLAKDQKLLARYCDEPHMSVCQGSVSPQSLTADSVGTDRLNLSWSIPSFMQRTPHSYNVTMCASTCNTLLYSYTNGSASMNVSIGHLTSATEYSIEIAAFVVRPDSVTDGRTILQSNPAYLQVKTAHSREQRKVVTVLKLLKLVSLAPPLWILYRILKKDDDYYDDGDVESVHDVSSVELSTLESMIDLIPEKTRGIG